MGSTADGERGAPARVRRCRAGAEARDTRRPPEDLQRRVLVFIRKAAPFAYCNACLALRCDASLADTVRVLAELTGDDAVLARTRRVCYGCGRTLEISALRDGPRP